MRKSGYTVLFVSLAILLPSLFLSSDVVEGQCLNGVCESKLCKEVCCDTVLIFNHYVYSPTVFPGESVYWGYSYQPCPGNCEDTYPRSVCHHFCRVSPQ